MVNSHVDYVVPDQNKLVLRNGQTHTYDALVVATGCTPNFDSVEGLRDALDDPESFVGSSYDLK